MKITKWKLQDGYEGEFARIVVGDSQGYKTTQTKGKMIEELSPPTIVKDVWSFLGMYNFSGALCQTSY